MKLTLRALRHNKGLRAVDVAQAIGVNVKTYLKWEHGNGRISFDTVKQLAQIYECDVNQIDA